VRRYHDFSIFQDGGLPPSWVFCHVSGPYLKHLVVFTGVQNLAGIHALVLIIWTFEYFARLAWKCLFTPPKLRFVGDWPTEWGDISTEPPKAHPSLERRHRTYRSSKSVYRCDMCTSRVEYISVKNTPLENNGDEKPPKLAPSLGACRPASNTPMPRPTPCTHHPKRHPHSLSRFATVHFPD